MEAMACHPATTVAASASAPEVAARSKNDATKGKQNFQTNRGHGHGRDAFGSSNAYNPLRRWNGGPPRVCAAFAFESAAEGD
jgi:hypothetical protein